jgi:hypothetical protein
VPVGFFLTFVVRSAWWMADWWCQDTSNRPSTMRNAGAWRGERPLGANQPAAGYQSAGQDRMVDGIPHQRPYLGPHVRLDASGRHAVRAGRLDDGDGDGQRCLA